MALPISSALDNTCSLSSAIFTVWIALCSLGLSYIAAEMVQVRLCIELSLILLSTLPCLTHFSDQSSTLNQDHYTFHLSELINPVWIVSTLFHVLCLLLISSSCQLCVVSGNDDNDSDLFVELLIL